MASLVVQTSTLLSASPMNGDVNSAALQTLNYKTGSVIAVWNGVDATDGVLYLQASPDGTNWGDIGNTPDDVGSVTINTASDSQQWAFPQGFPWLYIRMFFSHGTTTTGTMDITFYGTVEI